jgi:anaerobic selenocysteine-containing dehydrogenase
MLRVLYQKGFAIPAAAWLPARGKSRFAVSDWGMTLLMRQFSVQISCTECSTPCRLQAVVRVPVLHSLCGLYVPARGPSITQYAAATPAAPAAAAAGGATSGQLP